MTDMPPPKRIQTEPTLVLDREKILSESARIAIEKARAELGFESELSDEERLELERAERRDRPTLVPCPACAHCETCGGHESAHMVVPAIAAAFEDDVVPGPREEP